MKCSMKSIISTLLLAATVSWGGDDVSTQLTGRIFLAGESTPVQGAQVILFDLSNLSVQGIGAIDGEGRFAFAMDFASAPTSALPEYFSLQQNFPNPFNPSTVIPYELDRAAPVRLEIFNALGQQIGILVDGIRAGGRHRAIWDGRDDRGRGVAAGIYVYRLTVDGISRSRRMVLIDGRGGSAFFSELSSAGSDLSDISSRASEFRSFGLVVAGAGLETCVYPEIPSGVHSHHLEFEVARVENGTAPKLAVDAMGVLGDVNDDSVVNIVDALIIATYQINPDISIPNGGVIVLGDVNDDGVVDIVDALMVATYGVDPANVALPPGIGAVIELPNRPPVLATIGNWSVAPGDELVLELSASDPDGDPLSFAVSDHPDGASLTGHTFTWAPTPSQMGSYRLTFSVADGRGGAAAETITLNTPELIAELPDGVLMEFVWIDPGTFLMGASPSEAGRDEDEGPQHQVTITQGFYMGKYEITQAQWEAVVGTRPWLGMANVRETPNHPAVFISWDHVKEFIRVLNELTGDKLYRLPTEAEWEYAARAGTTTSWSFGDDESRMGDYAWYDANAWNIGEDYAHPVGTKLPNPWGLYDMHGNVGEWVQDAFGFYEAGPQVDPQGANAWADRVVRSGNFGRYSILLRSASRSKVLATVTRRSTIGSRLLRLR